MKKLLLVLLVVALASFLLVGCLPGVVVDDGDGDGDDEVVSGCPTIDIGAVEVNGVAYIKGDWDEDFVDFTITFAEPTEGVEVYIIPEYSEGFTGLGTYGLAVLTTADPTKKVYTGRIPVELFDEWWYWSYCSLFSITVVSCDGDCVCSYPFKVDWDAPKAGITFELSAEDCCPPAETLTISSAFIEGTGCAPADEYCCEEDCSGLASWKIDIYKDVPFDDCCDPVTVADDPCADPVNNYFGGCSGTDCAAIECEFACIDFTGYDVDHPLYVVFTLEDNVGHKTEYYGTIYRDTAESVVVTEFANCDFTDVEPSEVDVLGWDCLQ
ncbi:hypothetical protein CVT91_06570 [Candidatus Atribacteria bacterium HGW-Atribacteria-1]|nr:MAG: hypothetical protein CVT91_06570 [Candidatus Atribacteria bacterium HGW-Atribacteria-1]